MSRPGGGQRGEGEAQRVGAEGGDAVGKLLARRLSRSWRPAAAASGRWCALATSASRSMPSIRSIGSSTLPLDLDIFWPCGVAHQAVDVDLAERHVAHELEAHHDHAGDPEEDDVEAGDQHAGRVEASAGAAVCSGQPRVENGHSAEREPGVEHVLVLAQRDSRRPARACARTSCLAAADVDVALRRRTRPGCGGPTRSGG